MTDEIAVPRRTIISAVTVLLSLSGCSGDPRERRITGGSSEMSDTETPDTELQNAMKTFDDVQRFEAPVGDRAARFVDREAGVVLYGTLSKDQDREDKGIGDSRGIGIGMGVGVGLTAVPLSETRLDQSAPDKGDEVRDAE